MCRVTVRSRARIGLGVALAGGRPGRVHDWLEAWRGRALVASGTGAVDPELTDLLARLRHVLAERAKVVDDAGALERQEASLEVAIRSRARVTGRADSGATKAVSLAATRGLLGARTLVEYGVHGGDVFAVVSTSAKATLHNLGPVGLVDDELGHLMSGVRRVALQAARGRGVAATTAALHHALTRLDDALITPLGALGDGPLVVVPPAALLALPWGSLDGLRGRTVTVSPSVTVWARAVAVERRGDGVVLVAGPRLPHAAAEIAAVAAVHPATTVVGRGEHDDGRARRVPPRRPRPPRLSRPPPIGQPDVLVAGAGRRAPHRVRHRGRRSLRPSGGLGRLQLRCIGGSRRRRVDRRPVDPPRQRCRVRGREPRRWSPICRRRS